MEDIQAYCSRLPKVELHAHLNTSYSQETMQKLIALKENAQGDDTEELQLTSNHEIDESFRVFAKVQKLVRTKEAIYLLTKSVIEEFAAENVKYLELRSTPKEIPETGMTRELYMQTMIQAVKDCELDGLDIVVRLLVSLDRRHGVQVGEIAVALAEKLMKETKGLVLGIDFSGDPKVGDATDFIPVFLDAHSRGLKLALHLAEIYSPEETKNVLRACKNCALRIGHGTYLHRYEPGKGHDEMEDLVLDNKIPVEACLTSNLRTKTVDSVELHHFKYWMDKNHPVIICTDGKGVYGKTLTEEFIVAAETFNLSKQQLKEYTLSTVDSAFASDDIKEALRRKFSDFKV